MEQPLNIMTPEARANPYPLYAELRRGPIRQVEPGGMWAVSRYEDVVTVMKDPRRFSSAGLAMSFRPPYLDRNPTADSLVMKDPPEHGAMRARLTPAFGPAALAALEPKVRAIAEDIAERAVRRRELDFVSGVSEQMPVRVLGLLFGLDADRIPLLKVWADDLLSIPAAMPPPERQARIRQSLIDMERCFGGLIDERKERPGEDLISQLLRPGADGSTLTRDELMSFLFALVPAGVETTLHLLSNTLVVLARHPEVFERVRADLSLVPRLVEEVLRYEPPAHASLRLTTEETVLGGVTLPRGAIVAVLLGSAVHDERQYPHPDRFDLDRDKPTNIVFGHGIHFCVGAVLSRMEARLTLEALFSRIRGFTLLEEKVAWSPSFIARGPVSLPIRLDPA
ncbi:MAG TPA: cytochrome P450 [Myxococcaceae bacterium]|nr:cytochrome P450 [Myxococcaceae bacterium]